MRRSLRHSQAGFNLVEAAIVLGIAGLVIGGVFAAYSAVAGNNRVKEAQEEITLLVGNIRNAYAGQGSISTNTKGTLVPALIQSGMVPSRWVNGAGTGIMHPWTKDSTVGAQLLTVFTDKDGATSSRSEINITVNGIYSQKECSALVAKIYNSAKTSLKYISGNNTYSSGAEAAAAVCTDNSVSPTFSFSLKD